MVPRWCIRIGGGEAPKYDPDALATEGRVVVVTVTYRLGIFGYLNPTANGEGNFGLSDQLLALRWTQQNIAAFGGDPGRLTIFGQSAGGDSVWSLLQCDDADGLFERAILQSAPIGLRSGREKMTAAMAQAVTTSLNGVSPGDASVEQLLDAQAAAVTAAQRFGSLGGFPFAPIAGLAPLLAATETNRRLAAAARRVEILVGYTRDDANAFVAIDPRARRLRWLGIIGSAITRLTAKTMTRRIFGGPALALAQFWRTSGGEAATFRVDWAPPGAPFGGCIELPLLFGSSETWADAPMLGRATHPIDDDLACKVRGYWVGFAYKGVAALGSSLLRL